MQKKLDITKIEQNSTQTTISWHRYNDFDTNQDDLGTWTVDGNLTPDEVVAYAVTMVDQDILVSLNLQ